MANEQKNGDALPAKLDHKEEHMVCPLHPIENIVLLGRTGNGKSATGNSIAGKKVFTSRTHAAGVTMKCQTFRVVTPEGPILNVIDTPAECISKEMVRCPTLAEGGLHAVLLVISVMNRVSSEEEMVLSNLQVIFGSKIVDYLIVVFSAGDVLEEDGLTLEEYLDGCPDFLKRVLIMCGQRMILFDNRTTNEAKKTKQVHELLNLIDVVRKQNNYTPYTNEMYHQIQEETEQQLEAMKKELQLTYERNLEAMAETMMKTLKIDAEAKEKLFKQREIALQNEKNGVKNERERENERERQNEREREYERQRRAVRDDACVLC